MKGKIRMKRMKKLASLILTVVMVLSMTVAAFAEETNYTITVKHQSGTNVSLAGNTYKAYKLFDVTYNTERDAYAYTIASEFENFSYSRVRGEDLIEYVAGLGNNSEELNAFAQSVFSYITENNIAFKASEKVAEGADSVVLNVGEPGYYLVSGTATTENGESVIAACALNTAAPNTEVNVKADAPSLEKKIIENDKAVDANNAAIGDTVHYQITSKVPNMTGYEKYYFVVNDTLSAGLTFGEINKNSVQVKIGNANKTMDDDYTVEVSKNADGTTSMAIIFKNFVQYKDQVGADIVIDYTAVINENAVIGSEGNDNVAKLEYSNNPNVTPNGDPENPDKPGPDDPKGETPEDRVITYVTGIELIKVDGNDGDRLVGAEFEIKGDKINKVKVIKETFEEDTNGEYYKLTDGTFTIDEPAEENDDKYESTTVKYKKTQVVEWNETTETVSATGIVGTDGVLRFDGLAEGTYTITEVVAPNGYNLLEEPISVTITCTEPQNVDVTDTAEWKYSATGNGLNITNGDLNTDGRIELSIANFAGTLLPSTGGIGTTIFYAAGIILMAGAVFFVVRKKRA
jgi:fimbrial isopeptide formation D2 family protein/LPXTG-motif cell wall-anchored protein